MGVTAGARHVRSGGMLVPQVAGLRRISSAVVCLGLIAGSLWLGIIARSRAEGVIERQRFVISQLRRLARQDPLTNLGNRRHLMLRLDELVTGERTFSRRLCVAMLDLDRFKMVNDVLGHLTGDEVLRAVAAVMRSQLRQGDIAARYGGDEFCLILRDTDPHSARSALNRLHLAVVGIRRRRTGQGRLGEAGFRYGMAFWPDDGRTAGELIATADLRLCREKRRAALHSTAPL